MDIIGWFIANTHQLLGHDKAARVMMVDPGDKSQCLLCRFERCDPDVSRQDVIDAIGGAR